MMMYIKRAEVSAYAVPLLLNLQRSWGAIRKAVGLGDIEVTMTIYAHLSLDDKRSALTKLGSALT